MRCIRLGKLLYRVDGPRARAVKVFLGRRHRSQVSKLVSPFETSPVGIRWRLGLLRRVLGTPVDAASRLTISIPAPVAEFDFGRVRHRGMRLFDIRSRCVTRIGDPAAIASEARALADAARLGVAPSLLRADPKSGWLMEELVDGIDLPSAFGESLDYGADLMSELMTKVVLPLWFDPEDPVEWRLIDDEVDRMLAGIRLHASRMPDHEAAGWTELGESLRQAIRRAERSASATRSVPIAFSHGDLSPANVVTVPGRGWVAIDWEFADRRVAIFDPYFFALGGGRRPPPEAAAWERRTTQLLASVSRDRRTARSQELFGALRPNRSNLLLWCLAYLHRTLVFRWPDVHLDTTRAKFEGVLNLGPE